MCRRKLLSSFALAAACQLASPISHAEDIETFDLIVTLESASGPIEQDALVTCRNEIQNQEDLGEDRVLGTVTFQFDDQTGEAALLGEYEGSGVRRGGTDRPVYTLEFRDEYVQDNGDGSRTEAVETVSATYFAGSVPALSGTIEEVKSTIVTSSGERATCHFTYDVRGGEGVFEDGVSDEDITEPDGFLQSTIKSFREAVIFDDGNSRGVERVEARAAGGVRG